MARIHAEPVELPETRYARSGDLHIAYQVVGDGPIDLVYSGGWLGHVEARWELPPCAQFLRKLARFTRLIIFDKRGVGLSDPVPLSALPSLDEWMDDIRAVMDEAGSERAAIFCTSDGGPVGLLFAATYPERTAALILGNYVRHWPIPPDIREQFIENMSKNWGTAVILDGAAPSLAKDPEFRKAWARYERLAAAPGAYGSLINMISGVDINHILPSIQVPTLVLHRKDVLMPVDEAHYLVERIPGAKYVELPGNDLFVWAGDQDSVIAEIQEFLTGMRPAPETDRVLATVLFTDIVGSTERASELGDHRWRELLDNHDALVARQLTRFRGRAVKTTGDGFLATFDGPARAIRCAQAIRDGVRSLGLEIRAGLHTGEIEARGEDVGGIAVHIAARVAELAGSNEVLVSSAVPPLVAGSGIEFEDRGARPLKGVTGEWKVFAVLGD